MDNFNASLDKIMAELMAPTLNRQRERDINYAAIYGQTITDERVDEIMGDSDE